MVSSSLSLRGYPRKQIQIISLEVALFQKVLLPLQPRKH